VTAALARRGHDVRSFTIGFEEQRYDERPWARTVAALYHTHHTERVVHPDDVGQVFDRLIWHFDEPFNDYSYLPTYYVCREARTAITVALSGDGADEIFAGYRKYQRLALRQRWSGVLPRPLFRHAAALLPRETPMRRTMHQYGLDDSRMLADALTLGFDAGSLRSAARGALAHELAHYDPTDVVRTHLERAPPTQVGLINAMRYLDLKLTLGAGILVKVDRASMAVSLEVRPVYLHRDMLELAAATPADLLADPRQAKSALKSALRAWLPEALLYRPKQGFAMPLGSWLRADDRGVLRKPDANSPLAELIDPALYADLHAAHAAGAADGAARLHSLALLDRWCARWL
jgi:asparagine synthase (glutamine-hydrolysing)